MNRILSRGLLVLLVLVLATSTADAQRRRRAAVGTSTTPRFGPHLGYNFDFEALLVGAQLTWPITPSLELYPTFDYYFVDVGSVYSLNFDVKYRPPTRYGAWYVGGGLNYSRFSAGGGGGSSGDTNLNLLTGLEGRRGRTRPYVEAKFILGDGSAFQLIGGFSWR